MLTHRGPDEAGMRLMGPVGLAHRRLSIIDLASGQQPMGNAAGTVWITYNGELYNFVELREQLMRQGCEFQTRSDTEVVLRAWEVYGESCVDHLRGMFAFAIWDAPGKRLFMARDRLGIKPLYYCVNGEELLFGSEIKAILEATGSRPDFHREVLSEFLASRYVSGEETFFRGVRKLLPAHTLSWSPGEGIRQRRYWQPPRADHDGKLSLSDYTEMVRIGIKDAVQSHLVSDVPVGLFLSGGIDSSALAGIMAPMVDGPIRTFSVGFEESSANELEYARLAARSVGAEHRDLLVSPEQFFAALPYLIWYEDEPIAFTSSVPLHLVSRLAREHVKVVLTGEGADELFLGYDYRYRVTALNRKLSLLYQNLTPRALREGVAQAVPRLPRALRRYAERTFLAMDSDPRELFFENFSVFRRGMRDDLISDPSLLAARDPHAVGLGHYHAAGKEDLECMSHADMQTYMVELLMKQDQMSMSASIESRVPFLDHRLVEQVSSIPGRYRLRGMRTKALMRDAVREFVPREILTRRKMGFPVPTSEWLRGRFWPVVEEFVLSGRALARGHFRPDSLQRLAQEHRAGKADHGERLWLLINLEIWQRIFVDGESPSMIYADQSRQVRDAVRGQYQPAPALASI